MTEIATTTAEATTSTTTDVLQTTHIYTATTSSRSDQTVTTDLSTSTSAVLEPTLEVLSKKSTV